MKLKSVLMSLLLSCSASPGKNEGHTVACQLPQDISPRFKQNKQWGVFSTDTG